MTAALATFVVLLLLGTPIAVLMVMSGFAGAMQIGGWRYLSVLADQMFAGVSGYVLISVP